jgi:DNA-binding transcriptional LysR family regulator
MQSSLKPDEFFRKLSLRSLRVFDQVAEHGSTIKAAEVLNLSQSAVTKAIQNLESVLGVQLFVRTNYGMNPTEYAGILRRRVQLVLADFNDLAEETNSFLNGDSGQVAVGALISSVLRLVPLGISLLEKIAPRINVSLLEGTVEQLFPLLLSGRLSVVVGRVSYTSFSDYSWMQHGPIRSEVLLDEVLCLVVGRQHPLTTESTVNLKQLSAYRWVLPSPPSPTRRLVERMFEDARLEFPQYATESLSLLSNLGILLNSDAIAALPSTTAHEFHRLGLIHILPMDKTFSFGQVGYSVHADRPLTPATERFIESLRLAATQIQREANAVPKVGYEKK